MLLIENGFKLKTTLLRLIEADNPIAVTFICKHRSLIQEYSQDIMTSLPENDEYPLETTPILLAAEKNNYQIVKILLHFGASIPNSDLLTSKFDNLPTTQRTHIVYKYYNAVISEACLLQTDGNLMTDIFNLFKQLKKVKQEKKGMNEEFSVLTEKLEMVAKKALDLTINEHEARCLLEGDHGNIPIKCISCSSNKVPQAIKDALLLDMKTFIAHDKCQAVFMDLWYQHHFSSLRLSQMKRAAVAGLITIFYPILCVMYIIFPCRQVRRFLEVPFVKFLLNTASRLTFLAFLIYATLNWVITTDDPILAPNPTDEDIRNGYLMYRNSYNLGYTLILFIWILGMTARELNDVRRLGLKLYREIGCNIADMAQLILYWTYMIFHVVVLVEAYQSIQDEEWLSRYRPPPIPTFSAPSEIYGSQGRGPSPGSKNNQEPLKSSTSFGGETRLDWPSADPLLVAEAAFALANVLTFGRLLQTVVMVSGRLGVLAISLIGMVGDIVKFLILFAMILVSFSLGMTQLYRHFEEIRLKECYDDGLLCSPEPFISLFESIKTLFWALFGMNDLNVLEIIVGEERLTESVGQFMYALYLLVAVIVLLNALIAMMSSTYAAVEENAEMEWKFCRSKMMTHYIMGGAVFPPPFNLIPDIWHLLLNRKQKKAKGCHDSDKIKRRNDYIETNASIAKRYVFELQRQKAEGRLSTWRTRTKHL